MCGAELGGCWDSSPCPWQELGVHVRSLGSARGVRSGVRGCAGNRQQAARLPKRPRLLARPARPPSTHRASAIRLGFCWRRKAPSTNQASKDAVHPPGQQGCRPPTGPARLKRGLGGSRNVHRRSGASAPPEEQDYQYTSGQRESLEPQVLSGFFAPFWPTKKGPAPGRGTAALRKHAGGMFFA